MKHEAGPFLWLRGGNLSLPGHTLQLCQGLYQKVANEQTWLMHVWNGYTRCTCTQALHATETQTLIVETCKFQIFL